MMFYKCLFSKSLDWCNCTNHRKTHATNCYKLPSIPRSETQGTDASSVLMYQVQKPLQFVFRSDAAAAAFLVFDFVVANLQIRTPLPITAARWNLASWREPDNRFATTRRAFHPILVDQRPQWTARSTIGDPRYPQHYIVVRRKDSPPVPAESFHRFAWRARSAR
jgi:hypothetical protein